MSDKEVEGALFFWKDEPHITGYLTIGNEHFEIAGVRRSKVRADFTGRKIGEKQMDMFDGRSGDSKSECDQS